MIKLASNLQNLVKRSAKASPMSDYAMYGGAGALGGAGLGALINYLRDKSVAEGALVGGGIGGAAGLGTRGIMDLLARSGPERVWSNAETREEELPGAGPLKDRANPMRKVLRDLEKDPRYIQAKYDAGVKTLEDMIAYRDALPGQQLVDQLSQGTIPGETGAERLKNLREGLPGLEALQGQLKIDAADLEAARAYAEYEKQLKAYNDYQNSPEVRQQRDSSANIMQLDNRFDPAALDRLRNKGASARSKRSASSAGDYAMYGGAGALGGAGIGALINYLRDKSVAQGALVGGGLGGAAGLGTRGIMDLLKSREYSHAPEAGVGDEAVDYYKALQAARDQAESMPYRGDVEMADADASYEANADLRTAQEEVARLQELVDHYQGPEKARIEKAVGAQLRELNRPGSVWKEVALEDGGVLPAEIPSQFGGNKKTKK